MPGAGVTCGQGDIGAELDRGAVTGALITVRPSMGEPSMGVSDIFSSLGDWDLGKGGRCAPRELSVERWPLSRSGTHTKSHNNHPFHGGSFALWVGALCQSLS